jgi:GH15 family glucan-1,4-alpha-glucosidase
LFAAMTGLDQPTGDWAHEALLGGSPFPPIEDYAFLSDCETTALVAPSGNVEWLCLPRMDSESVFAAILDRSAGTFRFGPIDVRVPAARRYLPGTMLLETSWATDTGWVIVRDVLLMGPWHNESRRSRTHRRVPNDYDAEHVLLRTVRCVNGSVQMELDCAPAFGYGAVEGTWSYTGDSYYEVTCQAEGNGLALKLTSDMRLGVERSRAVARTLIKEGETRFVALSWSDVPAPQTYDEAYKRLVWTAHHWQHWLARGDFPDHPWTAHLARSALTLKGLSFAPTGAMMAAATTSLPETPRGERNWDYRYCWLRDSTFMLWALDTLGYEWEAADFFAFLSDVIDHDGRLQIMYGIGGERELGERTLDHLAGYEDARPVRVGNDAFQQRQHDAWGVLLDSFYIHIKSRDSLTNELWRNIVAQVENAITSWGEPDSGVWEVRGAPQHFTSSKVMCWVACDRGARLAELRGDLELAARWQAVANEIRADVCANAVDERGVFCQHYDTTALDASNLLIPLLRFLPADDPRVVATVNAIAKELTVDGLVLRYRVQDTDDGLSGEEGTFAICSFWLVSALAEIGEIGRARKLCQKLLSQASPLGLYAEEIDVRSGRHLGNFPQAFTHLALINAVMHVIRADQELTARAAAMPAAAPPQDVAVEFS